MANLATTNNGTIQNAADLEIPNGYISTVDYSTVSGKIELAQAINGAVSSTEVTGETLRVKNVVTTPGARSRTGEACTNTYLICEDGTTYFTQSDGIANDIKLLVSLFIDADGNFNSFVDEGVGLKIIEKKLSSGNTLKGIIPVEL